MTTGVTICLGWCAVVTGWFILSECCCLLLLCSRSFTFFSMKNINFMGVCWLMQKFAGVGWLIWLLHGGEEEDGEPSSTGRSTLPKDKFHYDQLEYSIIYRNPCLENSRRSVGVHTAVVVYLRLIVWHMHYYVVLHFVLVLKLYGPTCKVQYSTVLYVPVREVRYERLLTNEFIIWRPTLRTHINLSILEVLRCYWMRTFSISK